MNSGCLWVGINRNLAPTVRIKKLLVNHKNHGSRPRFVQNFSYLQYSFLIATNQLCCPEYNELCGRSQAYGQFISLTKLSTKRLWISTTDV